MRAIRLEEAFLCVLVLAGLAWGDPVSGKQEGKETSLAGFRPNIVLIIADDICWEMTDGGTSLTLLRGRSKT